MTLNHTLFLCFLFFAIPYAQAQTCLSGNCEEGNGKRKELNGTTYQGEFLNGKYHGYGVWKSLKGGSYQGQWRNGRRNGHGKSILANGNTYEGNWKNNAKYGSGKYTWINGNIYDGEWYSDKKFGQGTMQYSNGTTYQGQWVDNQYQGQGIFTWKNKALFDGTWADSKPNKGTLQFPDGKQYSGAWKWDGREGTHPKIAFIYQKETIAVWVADELRDKRPEELKKSDTTVNQPVTDDTVQIASSTPNSEPKTVDDTPPSNTNPTPPAPQGPVYSTAFEEEYGEQFYQMLTKIESDKQFLLERGVSLRKEMEKTAKSLQAKKLSTQEKEQLEEYLHDLESALIETEVALQDLTYKSTVLIRQMRKRIVEQDSTIQDIKEVQEEQRERLIWFASLLVIVLVILGGMSWFTQKLRRKNKHIARQNHEIEEKNTLIEEKKNALERQNQHVISSITYAQRIQKALLPHHLELQALLPESFALLMPCEIVSGDFYWMAQHNGYIFVAAVDCTGHGVPGAFMSLIGNDILNDLVYNQDLQHPEEILDALHHRVIAHLGSSASTYQAHDGMDIALCVIHPEEKKMEFAGAKNPLYILRGDELTEIKGDRMPIGGMEHPENSSFTRKTIELVGTEACYIFSDGYRDQFGGSKGKKLMKKRFKQYLQDAQPYSMQEQRKYLRRRLHEWMNGTPQLDDILVIGFNPNTLNTND